MEDNVSIGEEKFEFKKESISLKELVFRHLKKMSDITTQELTPGYWDEKAVNINGSISVIKKYHSDLREAFNEATDFLLNLIRPYIKEDKGGDFQTKLNKTKEKEKSEHSNAEKENMNVNDWIQIKLSSRKNLFSEIMLMLDRIGFFNVGEGEIEE